MEKKEYKSYPNPIVWNANARVMNFVNSDSTLIPNSGIIKAGMVFGAADEKLGKNGKTYEASTSATPKLLKEHSFTVGDELKSETITAIDTSNDDYDIITVASSITVTSGEIVSNTSGTLDMGDGLVTVLETVEIKNVSAGGKFSLSVTDKCIVDGDMMPNYSNKVWRNQYISLLAKNPTL